MTNLKIKPSKDKCKLMLSIKPNDIEKLTLSAIKAKALNPHNLRTIGNSYEYSPTTPIGPHIPKALGVNNPVSKFLSSKIEGAKAVDRSRRTINMQNMNERSTRVLVVSLIETNSKLFLSMDHEYHNS